MARTNSQIITDSSDRTGTRQQIGSKEEVYTLIKAALAELPRYDEPACYGVADDVGTNQRIIFFDLPRISPLQFNVPLSADLSWQDCSERIKQAIVARLKIASISH